MKLHEKSQQVVDETFAMYEDAGELGSIREFHGRTIVHLYPKGDTMDKDGNLNGYYQCRFFQMIVYNAETKKKYDGGIHDAIFTDSVKISSVSIFKDGSTTLAIDGHIKYLGGQGCTFYVD